MFTDYNWADWIKFIITSISTIDFLVFCVFFLVYIFNVPFKSTLDMKIGSMIIAIIFIVYKSMHLPVFLSTLPGLENILGLSYTSKIIIIGILTWSNIILAIVPMFLAIVTMIITWYYKNKKEFEERKINIVMPIYNEEPDALWNAIQSVNNLNYEKAFINLYLCFDGVEQTDALTYISRKFKKYQKIMSSIQTNVEFKLESDLNINIVRLVHGGKKSAQYGGYKLIKEKGDTNSIVFLIDSDIVLDKECINEFLWFMQKFNKTCCTGMISCSKKGGNFLEYYQDIEYSAGQIFWRNAETYMYSTSCLPGALTIMEFSALDGIAQKYFTKNQYKNTFEYQRYYLGEDRYMTHLLMEQEKYKVGFCENAKAKTTGPNKIKTLLAQRRRWTLGHISNDTFMLSCIRLWLIYPVFVLFNLLNNIRNTSIYIYLLYTILLLDNKIPLITWIIFIIVPVALNWLLLILYSLKIGRKMSILTYLCIIIMQPVMSMMYMYYSIITFKKKSWGGIRVAKEKIKKNTPEEV